MRRVVTLVVAALFLAVTAGGVSAAGFKVIVNKDNPSPGLKKGGVAFMFMKMATKWDHGAAVEPVDQLPDSPVRAVFSADIHGRSAEEIGAIWQRAIFAGRGEPPPQVGSDAEVVAWVASRPGGIGYVSDGADTSGVKVLTVTK